MGRTDNIDVRYAAGLALLFNVFMVVVAIIAILITVPKTIKPKTSHSK
jgi:DHA2 family multidrug resistance protein-like MFS transporter